MQIRRSGVGGEEGGGGKREIIHLSLHCHHQNDSGIKIGSDESRFNVSLIVGDKVTRQCPQTTQPFVKRKESRSRIEPRRPFCLPVPAWCLTAGPNRLTASFHSWGRYIVLVANAGAKRQQHYWPDFSSVPVTAEKWATCTSREISGPIKRMQKKLLVVCGITHRVSAISRESK